MFKRLILSFLLLSVKPASASDTAGTLLAGYGFILIHEAGHATASYLMGGEVLAFRPYPHKVRFMNEDGTHEDKWVAGLVQSVPFQGDRGSSKNALVAAMGSGTNLLSVLLLAPLLPELDSEFSKTTLDKLLFFSSFDMAAYTTVDLVSRHKYGDWRRVSDYTGVPLYLYWLGGIAAGLVVNEYRHHWHQRALPAGKSDPRFSVGFSTSY